MGANVVSMSLGCTSCYTEMEDDFYSELNSEDGVLIVAAAGNSGNSAYSYPASYSSVVSVAALDDPVENGVAGFSQFNSQVEIAAPGVDVLSTVPGNQYAEFSGTSMATPHVAAVAGLLWMYFPSCTNQDIRHAIAKSAKPYTMSPLKCDEFSGYGLVQAKSAYDLLSDGFCESNEYTDAPIG